MTADPYFLTLANYNAWANSRLYDACAQLSDDERKVPRRAFFGSIHATLNHLLVGDRLWMNRFGGPPPPLKLDQILYEDFAELRAARRDQDEALVQLVGGLEASGLDAPLHYRSTSGQPFATPVRLVLGHLFNHQRGQMHDMLTQTAVPPPELDLIIYVRLAPA